MVGDLRPDIIGLNGVPGLCAFGKLFVRSTKGSSGHPVFRNDDAITTSSPPPSPPSPPTTKTNHQHHI
ncbi:unnamed protein product [Rotaria sp. Silwood1]|nr:unnamed protein product [Rotaria sp. Silwood1]